MLLVLVMLAALVHAASGFAVAVAAVAAVYAYIGVSACRVFLSVCLLLLYELFVVL